MKFHNESIHGRDGGIDVNAVLEDGNDESGPATVPLEREDKETRRIVRKIDMRLLPVLAVIYSFALIDRVNLPNVSSSTLAMSTRLLTLAGSHCWNG